MKQGTITRKALARRVAPHAGAWIETSSTVSRKACAGMSPPTRGRGLKQKPTSEAIATIRVAPHAGAWIETPSECRSAQS